VAGLAAAPSAAKLDSDAEPVIRLMRHPKLVDRIRSQSSNPALQLIAFKLTHGAAAGASLEAVADLFRRAGPDLIVHNDQARRRPGGAFPADIHRRDGLPPVHCSQRAELGPALESLLLASSAPADPSTLPTHAPLP
jgi:hypothetical protein